ncbi:MAG: hypothetical protein IPJ32_04605 [Sphingobacteriaceae bacterium]|nr:hypothetical protein [Sphingobacteriaceae bacterium]
MAELAFKGNGSGIIEWFRTSQNKVFLEHLTFLNATQKGITQLERDKLKKQLENLDKINDFELNEAEIRSAIILLERKELKERLKKLEIAYSFSKIEKQNKFKYVSVFILVIVSSIILAVSIPNIRITY